MGKKPLIGLLGLGALSLALTGCGCKSCGNSRKDSSPLVRRTTNGQQVVSGQTQRPRTVPDGAIAGKTNEQPEPRPVTQPQRLVRDTQIPAGQPAPTATSFDRQPAPLTRVDGAGQPMTNLKGSHESSEDMTSPVRTPVPEVHEIPSAPAVRKFEEAPATPGKGPEMDKIPALPAKPPVKEAEPMPNPAVIPQIDTGARPVPQVEATPKVGTKPNPLPPEAPTLEAPTVVPSPTLAPDATPKATPEVVAPPSAGVTPPAIQPTGKDVPPPDLVPVPVPAPVPPG